MTSVYIEGAAAGAIPNGSTIEKCDSEPGDGHSDGARGTVLSSLAVPDEVKAKYPGIDFFYFVEWDDMPDAAVGITSNRVRTP